MARRAISAWAAATWDGVDPPCSLHRPMPGWGVPHPAAWAQVPSACLRGPPHRWPLVGSAAGSVVVGSVVMMCLAGGYVTTRVPACRMGISGLSVTLIHTYQVPVVRVMTPPPGPTKHWARYRLDPAIGASQEAVFQSPA